MSLYTAGREQVFSGHEYWRLFTSVTIHADIRHYLANAIFFFIFGFLLNSYFGFFVFPVLSIALGGLVNYLTLYSYPEHSILIGASGVVYFMAGLWATLFFFIERKDRTLKRLGMTICVSAMLFFPTSYEAHVSYLAHAWGFLLGIAVGILYFYMNKTKLRSAEVWKVPEPNEDPQLFADFDRLPESMDRPSDRDAV